MIALPQTFLEIILQITSALEHETALARSGALAKLSDAAVAKQIAFEAFSRACSARDPSEPSTEAEQRALQDLLRAANESALVLEAVQTTLGDFLAKLRAAVGALADSGTYEPVRRQALHLRNVLAVRVDARA